MPPIHFYRQKTQSVRAVQLTPNTVGEVVQWTGGRQVQEVHPQDEDKKMVGVNIPTLEGNVRASEGDYVVQKIGGGFEVWLAEEFEAQYERPTRGV